MAEGLITPTERSKQIDKYLKDEKKTYKKYMRKTMRLLLTGAGESGKSTIVKQMKILHKGGYTDSERLKFVPIIRSNLRDAILTITGQMQTLHPPVELANEDLKYALDYMLDEASESDFTYSDKFYDRARDLWEDEGVQECYARAHEYQLIDSAAYFLDRIDEIRESDYKPPNQDILRSRVMTRGVLETKFEIHMQRSSVNFHLLDVGGQRDERKKWVQCFSDCTAVIFVTACSGYDTFLREDQSINRLEESLQLYEHLWANRFLKDRSFILFLNKQDILAEKVAGGRSSIGTHFPAYNDYTPSDSIGDVEPGCLCCFSMKARKAEHVRRESMFDGINSSEFYKVKSFIKDMFQKLSTTDGINDAFKRRMYPHYTCAIDTEKIKRVFEDCKDMIVRLHLNNTGVV
ncbi:guanine nucleotide-binding protein G(s) subunit alpha-like isoform X1 [Amphiura filiformis]|uniref:guanine nucleotide-binding protein G(s) subunit alpha-like isoform X1 n=1 Tax=Amphiura filiformis TaxID=82378 RepID=UPI003B227D19